MKKEPEIAIVGATGLVGSEIVVALEELKVAHSAVHLFASQESAGEIYKVGEEEAVVEVLTENSFKGVDLVVFAAGQNLSARYLPAALQAGAVCIDSSGCYALEKEVPLIVPEINLEGLTPTAKIVATPCSPASQLAPVLSVIDHAAGLKRVVVSTYQSVSGAGKAALDELWEQTLAIFNQQEVEKEAFQHQIAFNCIPQIDLINESGVSREETRIAQETRKLLQRPDLRMSVTAVRVPVLYAHAQSVNVETERELEAEALIELLAKSQNIRPYPLSDYPMQLGVVGTDQIHVGRVRKDDSVEHGLSMWIVADNVRKGAAINTVQVIKRLTEVLV